MLSNTHVYELSSYVKVGDFDVCMGLPLEFFLLNLFSHYPDSFV